MRLKLYLFSAILIAILFAADGFAQKTFTATTNGKWSTMVWDQTGTPGAQDNVVIPDGDTVTFDSKGVQINDLTVGGGTGGVFQFSKVDTTSMVINGNLLVNAGATFKVQSNSITGSTGLLHTLELHGDLTHKGVVFDMRVGSAGSTLSGCTLILAGTKNSTLTLTTPYSTTNGDFNAVTINKTNGAKVILGSNVYMDGGSSTGPSVLTSILTFVNGIIETGPYIWVCQTSTAANVVGYSSASYIVGAMGRGISNGTPGSSKEFPVGDANSFELFNVRCSTAGGSTGHYIYVRCIPGVASTSNSKLTNGIDKVSHVRYYQVGYNYAVLAAPSMTIDRVRPSYRLEDGVAEGNTNLRAAVSTDTLATWVGLNQINVDTTKFTTPPSYVMDSLGTPIVLTAGGNVAYVALARVTGTTENSLEFVQGVEENGAKPLDFNLSQNYPNPFNPSTVINFSISKRSMVTLKIFNLLGREVATLVNSDKEPGSYNVNFNAAKLSNGVYFYKLTAGNNSSVKKMILMK